MLTEWWNTTIPENNGWELTMDEIPMKSISFTRSKNGRKTRVKGASISSPRRAQNRRKVAANKERGINDKGNV